MNEHSQVSDSNPAEKSHTSEVSLDQGRPKAINTTNRIEDFKEKIIALLTIHERESPILNLLHRRRIIFILAKDPEALTETRAIMKNEKSVGKAEGNLHRIFYRNASDNNGEVMSILADVRSLLFTVLAVPFIDELENLDQKAPLIDSSRIKDQFIILIKDFIEGQIFRDIMMNSEDYLEVRLTEEFQKNLEKIRDHVEQALAKNSRDRGNHETLKIAKDSLIITTSQAAHQ